MSKKEKINILKNWLYLHSIYTMKINLNLSIFEIYYYEKDCS